MAWRFDPLQNIVNLQNGGSAIELGASSAIKAFPGTINATVLTLSAWFNFSASTSFNYFGVDFAVAASVTDTFIFNTDEDGFDHTGLRFLLWEDSAAAFGAVIAPLMPGVAVGTWHHWLLALDVPGRRAALAVDGAPVAVAFQEFLAPINLPISTITIRSSFSDDAGDRPQQSLRLADLQLWTDAFISPATGDNLQNFYRSDGSAGRRVAPALAEAAFGLPTFRFRGGASKFKVSDGSNTAALAYIGSVNNYTAPPLWAP